MADVELSHEVLERYNDGVHAITEANQWTLRQALAAIDVADRDMVLDLMGGACRSADLAAAEYAAQYYRGLSILQTGADFKAKALSSFDQRALEVALKGIYRQATDENGDLDEELLLSKLETRMAFEVSRASKYGVWANGQRDRRDVRYARVPVGIETCAWCLMTAGLGYWYMTEEAASHTHAHCDCQIVASIGRGDCRIDGYDSTVYRDMWRNANKALRNGDVPSELSARVDLLSRTRDGYRTDTNGALAVMRWQYGLK